MRRTILTAATLATVILGVSLAMSAQERPSKGVLAVLSPGQAVNVKEAEGRYEIGIIRGGPQVLAHKVVEVGQDYVVVEDITGVTELRIPIYSIKAVSVLKMPGRR